MSEMYNRIDKLCQDKGINVTQMCKDVHISRSALTDLKKGRSQSLSQDYLNRVADYFGVSIDYIVGNEPKRFKIADLFTASPEHSLSVEQSYSIPIFASVSAGFGAYASSDIIGYMPIVITNSFDVDDTICIKVTGDSMYPKIEDGDIITVRKQATVDNGQIAVVRIGDECVVKKVELNHDSLKLISINPEYKDRVIAGADLDGVEIVGLVQQVTKKL